MSLNFNDICKLCPQEIWDKIQNNTQKENDKQSSNVLSPELKMIADHERTMKFLIILSKLTPEQRKLFTKNI